MHDVPDAQGSPSRRPTRRRGLLRATAGIAATGVLASRLGGVLGIAPARAATSPYPSAGIPLSRLDHPWLWREACESDQWPHVAVSGTKVLGVWGDGYGWARGSTETKAYLGVTAISGTAERPVGADTWSDPSSATIRNLRLKPCGLLKVDDWCILYATGDIDGRDATRMLRGTADGRSFTLASDNVVKRSVHGLQVVGSVHRAVGSPGELVLLLARDGNVKGFAFYDTVRNTKVWAARVTASTLADVGAWEWFCGRDASGNARWSRARVSRAVFTTGTGLSVVPVFQDPAGCGKHVMISWCPSLNGYVLAKTHAKTALGLFFGTRATGPWRTLFYGPFVPPSADGKAQIFTAQLVSMWSKGGRLALAWGGHPGFSTTCAAPGQATNYDAVYLTRFAASGA